MKYTDVQSQQKAITQCPSLLSNNRMMATSYLNSKALYSADQGIGKSRDAKKVLIGKNVVMIVVFEQIDDNSEKSQVCVGASALQTPRQLEK